MAAANSNKSKGPAHRKRRTATRNPTTLRLSSLAASISSRTSRKSLSSSSIHESITSGPIAAATSSKLSMGSSHAGVIIGDSRFSFVHSDPRFQSVPQHKSKVLIDSRFRSIVSDSRFSSSTSRALVDKRGRLRTDTDETPLSRYYKIVEPCEEEERLDDSGEVGGRDIDEGEVGIIEENLFLRGKANSDATESDTDTDTSSDFEYGVDIDEAYPSQDEDIPTIEKETHRLAVVNMDWNHVRATDIYVILASCVPKGGRIMSVAVYPSEFGISCMAEEAGNGPVGLSSNNTDDDSDNEAENEIFRNYEKKRLRYYYAVVECDSARTADYIYKSYDGVEIERSSNVLDLRFIPDSVEFKEEPRDVATGMPEGYKSLDFYTEALQKSKISISWDEDEPQRIKALRKNFTADELADMELKEFLASDDSETEEEDETLHKNKPERTKDKCAIYRALLKSGKSSSDEEAGLNEGQDMEVTFNTGLENLSKRLLERKTKDSETLWETYLRKRKEKRKDSTKRSDHSSGYGDDESDGGDSDLDVPGQHDDFFVQEPSLKKHKDGHHGKVKKAEEGVGVSREELELLLAADDNRDDREEAGAAVKGYNMKSKKLKEKKKKKKRKGRDEDDISDGDDKIPEVDYDDPRFSELFTSPLFALDPTNPQFKRSDAYARKVSQKKKLKSDTAGDMEPEETGNVGPKSDNEKQELSLLVKSLKAKSRQKLNRHV